MRLRRRRMRVRVRMRAVNIYITAHRGRAGGWARVRLREFRVFRVFSHRELGAGHWH